MSNHIIVTTGIYDAIKDTLRRKKVSIEEEKRLTEELRKAKQVLRRDLPADICTCRTTSVQGVRAHRGRCVYFTF